MRNEVRERAISKQCCIYSDVFCTGSSMTIPEVVSALCEGKLFSFSRRKSL